MNSFPSSSCSILDKLRHERDRLELSAHQADGGLLGTELIAKGRQSTSELRDVTHRAVSQANLHGG